MSELDIKIVCALRDNYIYILHDHKTGNVAAIDPSEPDPVLKACKENGWQLTHILNTHHHADHVGGNLYLKKKTNCTIIGHAADSNRIPGIDIGLSDGEIYPFGATKFKVIAIPGHTLGAVAYYFKSKKIIFTGDTIFTMGCGRLFEGTPEMMFASLKKITKLPKKTKIFSGHEYAETNACFALSVEPNNQVLIERFALITKLPEAGEPIQPSFLNDELETNPFLRTNSKEIRKNLGLRKASNVAVFAELRRLKDNS